MCVYLFVSVKFFSLYSQNILIQNVNKCFLTEFLNNVMRIANQYGEVTANWLGPILYVVTYTAEDAEVSVQFILRTLLLETIITRY